MEGEEKAKKGRRKAEDRPRGNVLFLTPFSLFFVCETACCAPVRFSLRSSLSLPLYRRPFSISIEEGRPRTREGGDFEFVFVFLRYIRSGKKRYGVGFGKCRSLEGRERGEKFPSYFPHIFFNHAWPSSSIGRIPPSLDPPRPSHLYFFAH